MSLDDEMEEKWKEMYEYFHDHFNIPHANLHCPCRIDFHSCTIDELIDLSRTKFV